MPWQLLSCMIKISKETDLHPIIVETCDQPVYYHYVVLELDGNP